MFQGNWPCSTCDATITQLPFEPRSDKGLTCRDCYFKQKDGQAAAVPADDSVSAAADEQPAPPADIDFAPAEEQPSAPEFADAPAAAERKMFSGEWKCGMCGGAITSLPFEPRGDAANLKCIDCFKTAKA